MVKQGDIVKISLNPQKGHEQAGFRPAVVVSNKLLNDHSVMSMLCPVTHTNRKNPFHVEISNNPNADGFIMCDQLKSLDLSSRNYRVVGHVSEAQLETVLDRISMLLEKE